MKVKAVEKQGQIFREVDFNEVRVQSSARFTDTE